jgi:hypothetical protein
MSFQVRAEGGSWPSIGSVAEPLNEMTSPTFQRVPAAGDVIVAVGPPEPTRIVTWSVPSPPRPSLTCSFTSNWPFWL